MLNVENLSCSRGPRQLFAGLSFTAAPGEWIRVVGPNGSGKTTLLRALAGLTRPEAGRIDWTGDKPLAESRAYVGHAPGWKDTLTVTENLRLAWSLDGAKADDGAGDGAGNVAADGAGGGPGNKTGGEARALAHALAKAGLERQRNLSLARLSQGQKKRLHLARLARSTRPLWLLDEPTAALDDAGARLFSELVSDHLAGGGIAVIATHLPLGITAKSFELAIVA